MGWVVSPVAIIHSLRHVIIVVVAICWVAHIEILFSKQKFISHLNYTIPKANVKGKFVFF